MRYFRSKRKFFPVTLQAEFSWYSALSFVNLNFSNFSLIHDMLNDIIIITIASSADFDVLCVKQIQHSNLKTLKSHTNQTIFTFKIFSYIIHNLYNIARKGNTVCILTFFVTVLIIHFYFLHAGRWRDICVYLRPVSPNKPWNTGVWGDC